MCRLIREITEIAFRPTDSQNRTMAALCHLARGIGHWVEYPLPCLDGDTGEVYFTSNNIGFGIDRAGVEIQPDGSLTRILPKKDGE